MDFTINKIQICRRLGMKYKLKLVTNVTLVIDQKIDSKNPLKILSNC